MPLDGHVGQGNDSLIRTWLLRSLTARVGRRSDERAAQYVREGMQLTAVVWPVQHPQKRAVRWPRRGGDAMHSRPFEQAMDAVRYAEQVPLAGPAAASDTPVGARLRPVRTAWP